MQVDKRKFEVAILSIFLFAFFRQYMIVNQGLIFIATIPLGIFILSTFFEKNWLFGKLRFVSLILLFAVVYGFLFHEFIDDRVNERGQASVHDSVAMTDYATKSLLIGQNPYDISFENVLKGQRFYNNSQPTSVLNSYVYSPLNFIINTPFYLVSNSIFGFVDTRISLLSLFILSAVVGLLIVQEKILFLIVFLFNPIFAHSFFIGVNDVLPLFFLISIVVMLYFKKITWATILLGLSVGTKLTVYPFVFLYFLYLINIYSKKRERFKLVLRQAFGFILISGIIYLPFLIWNKEELIKDIFIYPVAGGEQSYPITGILGIPQLLLNHGVISAQTSFPFFLFQPFIVVGVLFFSNRYFKKHLQLASLLFLYVIFFIVSFVFQRVFQPNYLDFLSQVLIFSAFIKGKKE